MAYLRQLFRITAFRLSILYTLLFGALAIALVIFVSFSTNRILISEIRTAAQEEVTELASIYSAGGAGRLIKTIERRSRTPGAYLYLISDPQGRIIAGNVKSVDPSLFSQTGWSKTPFEYVPLVDSADSGSDDHNRAIAQIFSLPQGLLLLVGRDIGEANSFRSIVVQAIGLALIVMLLFGILLWLIIGRRALKRLDEVSNSSAQIISGDLSGRLPSDGSGDEFDRLANHLNGLIARIEKLDSGVRVMSDNIAHDLKTPLTRLRNRAETAISETPKRHVGPLEEVISDADGILKTFDALLMISQVQSGSRRVAFSSVDVSNIAKNMAELFEPTFAEEAIEFTIDISEGLCVEGNQELIAQAITNLLDNAIKYGCTLNHPSIGLYVSSTNGRIKIGVWDNGVGIPINERERVLERFVRLDESRSKPGTGLGLSLVNAIAQLHHGCLKLMDKEPGLMVEMELPEMR